MFSRKSALIGVRVCVYFTISSNLVKCGTIRNIGQYIIPSSVMFSTDCTLAPCIFQIVVSFTLRQTKRLVINNFAFRFTYNVCSTWAFEYFCKICFTLNTNIDAFGLTRATWSESLYVSVSWNRSANIPRKQILKAPLDANNSQRYSIVRFSNERFQTPRRFEATRKVATWREFQHAIRALDTTRVQFDE